MGEEAAQATRALGSGTRNDERGKEELGGLGEKETGKKTNEKEKKEKVCTRIARGDRGLVLIVRVPATSRRRVVGECLVRKADEVEESVLVTSSGCRLNQAGMELDAEGDDDLEHLCGAGGLPDGGEELLAVIDLHGSTKRGQDRARENPMRTYLHPKTLLKWP